MRDRLDPAEKLRRAEERSRERLTDKRGGFVRLHCVTCECLPCLCESEYDEALFSMSEYDDLLFDDDMPIPR